MVTCKVTREGEMPDCSVEQEAPSSEGFGEAALKLMPKFRMRPMTKDGVPVDAASLVFRSNSGCPVKLWLAAGTACCQGD